MNARNSLIAICTFALFAATSTANALSASEKGSTTGQCDIQAAALSGDSPLLGLWRVTSYREINGYKSYTDPGDPLLIAGTGVPGEVCVEFTLPIEGSQHFYLAIEPDGKTIDETVFTEMGGELRIIIRANESGAVNFVLYNRPLANGLAKGGPDEGGAVGEIETWH